MVRLKTKGTQRKLTIQDVKENFKKINILRKIRDCVLMKQNSMTYNRKNQKTKMGSWKLKIDT